MAESSLTPIEIGLTAAIVAVEGEAPSILVAGEGAKGEPRAGLPSGPFDPLSHRTFEIGLRAWVEAQTGLSVGYVEQLYTFGDRGRHARPDDTGAHTVSIGYLALTRTPENVSALAAAGAGFEPWYRFFPWEDWREQRPKILDSVILPLLDEWAGRSTRPEPGRALGRRERLRLCFATSGGAWDEERTLDRYELPPVMKPASPRRRGATAARPRSHAARCRRSASRCGSTIAASSPPRSRGCAPSSNTGRWCSS